MPRKPTDPILDAPLPELVRMVSAARGQMSSRQRMEGAGSLLARLAQKRQKTHRRADPASLRPRSPGRACALPHGGPRPLGLARRGPLVRASYAIEGGRVRVGSHRGGAAERAHPSLFDGAVHCRRREGLAKVRRQPRARGAEFQAAPITATSCTDWRGVALRRGTFFGSP